MLAVANIHPNYFQVVLPENTRDLFVISIDESENHMYKMMPEGLGSWAICHILEDMDDIIRDTDDLLLKASSEEMM